MKKWLPFIVIIGIIFIIGAYMVSINNKLVVLDQKATAQWANVESSYQRRADLIPNIVSTAKVMRNLNRKLLFKLPKPVAAPLL